MIGRLWRKRADPAAEAGSRTGDSRSDAGPEILARSASDAPPPAGAVHGERGAPLVSGVRSLQSRMSSLLAAALMMSVGAGMLAWYYAEALSRPAAPRGAVQAPLPEIAGEGMTLPSFGSGAKRSAAPPAPATLSAQRPSSPLAPLPPDPLLEPPLSRAPQGSPRGYGAPMQPSPRERALERRLSGGVFADGGRGRADAIPVASAVVASRERTGAPDGGERAHSSDALQMLLRPGVLQGTQAQVLPTQHLLLPKGTFIDCTLETAIDSTLPGMTTCVTATDTFGADGSVVLLERGSKLIGETRGEVRQGQARVFVVWTEARTPTGVVVRLDSPGTDELGRSGLEGKVNRHFWQRFGAAALVSMIDGAVQAKVQSSSRGGTVVLDPTASEDVLTEILRGTVDIPPTIRVRNGARIQVLVARDIDFRSVYELEPR
jgi:type IV secretion system protein VirB10